MILSSPNSPSIFLLYFINLKSQIFTVIMKVIGKLGMMSEELEISQAPKSLNCMVVLVYKLMVN